MGWLRWGFAAVSPALIAVAVYFGASIAFNGSNNQCDTVFLVAGKCTEPWHTTAVDFIIYLSVAFVVTGLVLVPALIAPRFKKVISILGLLISLFITGGAFIASGWPDLLTLIYVTLFIGLCGVCFVWKIAGRIDNG